MPGFALRGRPPIALVLTATVLLTACGQAAAPTPTTSPLTTAPAATPTSTIAPAPATTTPATAGPTTGPVAIAEGTYVTAPMDLDDWRAAINGDDKLTDAEKERILGPLFELDDHETIVIQLKLVLGQWVQSAAFDGGAFDVGSHATFAFPDASTVTINEECCGLTSFAVTPVGDGFALKRASKAPNELEAITARLIFESEPFQPAP